MGVVLGLGTLSVNIAEERETVEDMYEPYLIQKGLCHVDTDWARGDSQFPGHLDMRI